ncbi:triose-phosphate isomerase [Salininema proteolyticum]|uniref:Triosephosphate isomerase n=1 Tax=Salininema proteolyticum TaxID=1607685 RepID=A0ABV8U0B4_9ACTN
MSNTRKPLIAGNWKMNLNHLEAIALVQKIAFSLTDEQLEAVEAAVLPPFVDIRSVQTLIDGDKLKIAFGAQDLSAHAAGAYTGEVSGSMLAKLGCAYVCVGHSERRQYHGEDDETVGKKVRQSLNNGLSPILCVGEELEVRDAGDHVSHTVGQLLAAVDGLTAEEMDKIVVAYEPVWAIGTGRTATPEDAQEVSAALRKAVADKFGGETAAKLRVLYGGSVKSANCASIMSKPDVDGALVGGASLDAEEFAKLIKFPEETA